MNTSARLRVLIPSDLSQNAIEYALLMALLALIACATPGAGSAVGLLMPMRAAATAAAVGAR